MFTDKLAEAIGEARTLARLDDLARAIWQAHAAGGLEDNDAQRVAEQLEAKRKLVRGDIKPVGIPAGRNSIFPPRRVQTAAAARSCEKHSGRAERPVR